jgi:hypothetical protein
MRFIAISYCPEPELVVAQYAMTPFPPFAMSVRGISTTMESTSLFPNVFVFGPAPNPEGHDAGKHDVPEPVALAGKMFLKIV